MAEFDTTQAGQFEKLISKSRRSIHLSSGLWPRYLRGDVMPRGSLERRKANLVSRLEDLRPGTSKVFYHAAWELLDFQRLLGPAQLRTLCMTMDEKVWTRFVSGSRNESERPAGGPTPFWKVDRSVADLQRNWSQTPGFDGLAVCLIEARMGYLAQDEVRFTNAILGAASRLARLAKTPGFQLQRQQSALLLLESSCLHLAEHFIVRPSGTNSQLSLMVQNRRDECESRTQAHLGLLTKPARALFLKWAKGLAKSEYSW